MVFVYCLLLVLELHVCLPDLSHLTLMIDQQAQATEIMDMIIESLGLTPHEARHVLSLWLVSSDLGKFIAFVNFILCTVLAIRSACGSARHL